MSGEIGDNTPVELSDLINRVLDKGAVIAGSVTISVGDIDLIQLDLTVVLTAIETARAADQRRRELESEAEARVGGDVSVLRSQ
jgi:gas vesicle structural protein